MKADPDKPVKALSYTDSGELVFHNRNISEICRSQKAPFYLYSAQAIKTRAELFRKEIAELGVRSMVFYAVKANTNPRLMRIFRDCGFGADVVSLGELRTALASGFSAKEIIFSGVAKSYEELQTSIELGIFQINVESVPELLRLKEIAESKKKKVAIGIRLNPNIDPGTHPYITTGLMENKFGVDEDAFAECLRILENQTYVELKGLSLHLGSQLLDFAPVSLASQWLLKKCEDLRSLGFQELRLDMGGGLGLNYHADAEADEANLIDYVRSLSLLRDFNGPLLFEPGRFLVGRAGILCAQVEYVKRTPSKVFVILNSGMNHLIRPALYGASHRILPVKKPFGSAHIKADIVGPICESADVLAKDYLMESVVSGDWLCICDTGAYGYSMASQYNGFPLPNELIV